MSIAPSDQTKRAASVWEQRAKEAINEKVAAQANNARTAKRAREAAPDSTPVAAASAENEVQLSSTEVSGVQLNMDKVNAFLGKTGGASTDGPASLNASMKSAKPPAKPLPQPKLGATLGGKRAEAASSPDDVTSIPSRGRSPVVISESKNVEATVAVESPMTSPTSSEPTPRRRAETASPSLAPNNGPKVPHYAAKKVSLNDLIAQEANRSAAVPSWHKPKTPEANAQAPKAPTSQAAAAPRNTPSAESSKPVLESTQPKMQTPQASQAAQPKPSEAVQKADSNASTQPTVKVTEPETKLNASTKVTIPIIVTSPTAPQDSAKSPQPAQEVKTDTPASRVRARSALPTSTPKTPSLQDLIAQENAKQAAPPSWSRSKKVENVVVENVFAAPVSSPPSNESMTQSKKTGGLKDLLSKENSQRVAPPSWSPSAQSLKADLDVEKVVTPFVASGETSSNNTTMNASQKLGLKELIEKENSSRAAPPSWSASSKSYQADLASDAVRNPFEAPSLESSSTSLSSSMINKPERKPELAEPKPESTLKKLKSAFENPAAPPTQMPVKRSPPTSKTKVNSSAPTKSVPTAPTQSLKVEAKDANSDVNSLSATINSSGPNDLEATGTSLLQENTSSDSLVLTSTTKLRMDDDRKKELEVDIQKEPEPSKPSPKPSPSAFTVLPDIVPDLESSDCLVFPGSEERKAIAEGTGKEPNELAQSVKNIDGDAVLEYPDEQDGAHVEDTAAPEMENFGEGSVIEEVESFDFIQTGMLHFLNSGQGSINLPQANLTIPNANLTIVEAAVTKGPRKEVEELKADEEFDVDDHEDTIDEVTKIVEAAAKFGVPTISESKPESLAASTKSEALRSEIPAGDSLDVSRTDLQDVAPSGVLPDPLAMSDRSTSSDILPVYGSDPSNLFMMLGNILESSQTPRTSGTGDLLKQPSSQGDIPLNVKAILQSVAEEMNHVKKNSMEFKASELDTLSELPSPKKNDGSYELDLNEQDQDDLLNALDSVSVQEPIAEEENLELEGSDKFNGSGKKNESGKFNSSLTKPKRLIGRKSSSEKPPELNMSRGSSLTITVTSPSAAPETPKSSTAKKGLSLAEILEKEKAQTVEPPKFTGLQVEPNESKFSASMGNLSTRSSPGPGRKSVTTGMFMGFNNSFGSPRSDDEGSEPNSPNPGDRRKSLRKSKSHEALAKDIEEAKRVAEIQAQMDKIRQATIQKCQEQAELDDKLRQAAQDETEQARLRARAEALRLEEEEKIRKMEIELERQRKIDAEIREKAKQDELLLINKARSGKRMSFYEKKLADKALGITNEEEETATRSRRHSSMLSERPEVLKLAASPKVTDDVKKVMETLDAALEEKAAFWESLGNVDNTVAKLRENSADQTVLILNVSAALDQYPIGDPERIRLCKDLANAIADHSYLSHVEMTNSKLDDVFACELGKRLGDGAMPQLETLILDSNGLTGKGLAALMDGLQDMVKHQAIRTIKVTNQSSISTEAEQAALNMLKFNLAIRDLSLDFRRQTDSSEATRLLARNATFSRGKGSSTRPRLVTM